MGSYTPVEMDISNMSNDKLNEMYLSGDLDKMYEDFERHERIMPWTLSKYKRDEYRKEMEIIETI